MNLAIRIRVIRLLEPNAPLAVKCLRCGQGIGQRCITQSDPKGIMVYGDLRVMSCEQRVMETLLNV